jgi:hypothetical protein
VDFPKFLGIAMETLTTMCDDADVDVRIVADECLNRLIRVSIVLIFLHSRLLFPVTSKYLFYVL